MSDSDYFVSDTILDRFLLPLYKEASQSKETIPLSDLNTLGDTEVLGQSPTQDLSHFTANNKIRSESPSVEDYQLFKNQQYSRISPETRISKTLVFNFLEIVLELTCFIFFYVPFVPIKHNESVPWIIRGFFPRATLSIPDFVALFNFSIVSIFINWVVFANVLPLLVSRIVNFSKRVVVSSSDYSERDEDKILNEKTRKLPKVSRIHKYDPLMFALCKLLVHYYIYMHCALLTIVYFGKYKIFRTIVTLQLGIYNFFLVQMGVLPLLFGFTIVVCSLYSRLKER